MKEILFVTLISLVHFCKSTSSSYSDAHIRCDYQNKVKVGIVECLTKSDLYTACCYLYADLATPSNSMVDRLCLPMTAQADPYPEFLVVAGLGFNVRCPNPTPQSNLPIQPIRGTPCGPSVTYHEADCATYSYNENRCCLATYSLDLDGKKTIHQGQMTSAYFMVPITILKYGNQL